jgi:hypothetical protein
MGITSMKCIFTRWEAFVTISVKNTLTHAVTLTVLGTAVGLAGGYFTSKYFYDKSLSENIRIATEAGETKGHAKGEADGLAEGERKSQAAFEKNMPQLLEQRFAAYLDSARKLSFSDGQKDGYESGNAAGEKDGFARGNASASTSCDSMRSAETNWRNYAAGVSRAARREHDLGSTKLDFDNQLFELASAIVRNAQELQTAYKDQARSFDSTIELMADALAKKDFNELRRLVVILNETLPTKENLFLSANKQAQAVFDSFQKTVPQ